MCCTLQQFNGCNFLGLQLIRRMLRHMLCLLRQRGWKSEEISSFVGAINMTSVDCNNDNIPDGLRYHIVDIYVDELNEADCGQVSHLKSSMNN
jgi:Nucleolar protein,Nop52